MDALLCYPDIIVSINIVNAQVTIGETNIIINAAEGQDAREIADEVDQIITMRLQQAEEAWA